MRENSRRKVSLAKRKRIRKRRIQRIALVGLQLLIIGLLHIGISKMDEMNMFSQVIVECNKHTVTMDR